MSRSAGGFLGQVAGVDVRRVGKRIPRGHHPPGLTPNTGYE